MKNILRSLPLALLILLYVYAVTSKLAGLQEFRGQLHNQNFGPLVADILLFLLPALEILSVCLMFLPRWQGYGLLLSIGLLTAFTTYISLVELHFWDRVPCSCGGILSKMSWTTHLLFNIAFILINLLAIYFERRDRS